MSVTRLLSRWRADPSVAENIAAWETLPAAPASYQALPADLKPALVDALHFVGITALYSHQSAAWRLARQGRDFAVVTGTASGKTLCYNLPVFDRLLADPEGRALYLFPTKALAQDQASKIRQLCAALSARSPNPSLSNRDLFANDLDSRIPAGIYDGDTPTSYRPQIRQNARLLVSNPDMLHTAILPHHTSWAAFFRSLRFVVIDEMHVYRGVFGAHVANVLRRLRRITRHYGADPQFILTSATIGNPADLANRLVEPSAGKQPVAVIDQDGSAHGARHFLIYNPPVVDEELGLRRSASQEGIRLASDMLAYRVQTILFARSRRAVEIMLSYLRNSSPSNVTSDQDIHSEPGQASPGQTAVRGYRSGYLPSQRREIEHGLRHGTVRAVVATNALELGIDIGGMGAALLVGYPGSIAAVWQQTGRAGRGVDASLSILVATADPLDQFLARHSAYFFSASPENALLNADNMLILLAHLRCAAFELPFQAGDGFGDLDPERLAEFLTYLQSEGLLHRSGDSYYWMADQYPAQAISLRSVSAGNVVLQVENDPPSVIGQIDGASAVWMVHPQAIYLHEGSSYLVEDLDLPGGIAHLRRIDTDYYTEHRSETTVELLETYASLPVPGGQRSYGEIKVTTQVIGYRKIRWYTHEVLGLADLTLPPSELLTMGYWIGLSDDAIETLRQQGMWTNDPNQYGPGWPRLRELVRQRDGYRCQVCGRPEQGRAHDVHHKTPFRLFNSLELANSLDNLVTLCSNCHHRVELGVRVRSGLSGLGYLLSRLAPLFLMCDPRDLGASSDPQSPLAGGKPAVVLYDQVPAGIGFSEHLYRVHADLVASALEQVHACACTDGCPSCVGPGAAEGAGSKAETRALLELLAGEPG